MTLTVDALEQTLTMLRRQRVKYYEDVPGDGFRVEFFADEPSPMPDSKKKPHEVDVCLCGHAQHAHMNGFCVEGCSEEQCSPKAEVK